jgi:hypothetical protein
MLLATTTLMVKRRDMEPKYLESRKEKTSPIHAQNEEEEEEERKTPRRPKKEKKIQAKATATHRLLCNWSNAC